MPTSGARSGTRPSRSSRGAGDGSIDLGIVLACGHTTLETPITNDATGRGRLYRCPFCGLQPPGTRAAGKAPRTASAGATTVLQNETGVL